MISLEIHKTGKMTFVIINLHEKLTLSIDMSQRNPMANNDNNYVITQDITRDSPDP